MTSTLSLPYIQAKDCAAKIRKDLKTLWPQVKFSVTTRHGNSITIEWTDGPNAKTVEAVGSPLVGCTWDSDQDLDVPQEIQWEGKPARSHLRYLSTSRAHSKAFVERVMQRWQHHEGFEDLGIQTSSDRAWVAIVTPTTAAYALQRWVVDDVHRSSALAPEVSQPLSAEQQQAYAVRVEDEALKMQPKIDRLSVPAFDGLALTARRARFRKSKLEERDAEQRIQNLLFALASAAKEGKLPAILQKVTKQRHVRELLRPIIHDERGYRSILTYDNLDTHLLTSLGIEERNWDDATQAIRQLDAGDTGAAARAQIEKEQSLLGVKIPGFFPTPLPLVDQMLEEATILDHHTVLEPSAGRGDIADRIREKHRYARLTCVELNLTLASILQEKGHTVIQGDFLQHEGEYNRIVMNPPFEKGQDMQHIQYAYSLLSRFGILVAICSEGPFSRQDRASQQFRTWLEEVHATVTPLPEGSFSGPEAFRQTGVRTRMVVIAK